MPDGNSTLTAELKKDANGNFYCVVKEEETGKTANISLEQLLTDFDVSWNVIFPELNTEQQKEIKSLQEELRALSDKAKEVTRKQIKLLSEIFTPFLQPDESISDLMPGILKEFQKAKYSHIEIDDLINSMITESDKLNYNGIAFEILSAARESHQKPQSDKVKVKKFKDFNFPVDKLSSKFWLLKGNIRQIDMTNYCKEDLQPLKAERDEDTNKEKRTIYYGIDFGQDDKHMRVTKQLTSFDRRVHDAVGNLYLAGNELVSLTQISIAMGGTSKPSPNMLDRITESLDKMRIAQIIIDQSEDYPKYGNVKKEYKGSVVNSDREKANINGIIIDAAVRIYRLPLLMQMAMDRRQIAIIPKEVLESGKRQTENNLAIENYLIHRIARMLNQNNKRAKPKILFQTVFNELNITDRKVKQRTIETIEDYLKHYAKVGWIAKYTSVENGVEIWLPKDNKSAR